jgi:hypothetical protein
MITLTEDQENLFNTWIQKHIKECGHDFAFGFYVILEGEMMHLADPKYYEWYETKKKEFLIEQNK